MPISRVTRRESDSLLASTSRPGWRSPAADGSRHRGHCLLLRRPGGGQQCRRRRADFRHDVVEIRRVVERCPPPPRPGSCSEPMIELRLTAPTCTSFRSAESRMRRPCCWAHRKSSAPLLQNQWVFRLNKQCLRSFPRTARRALPLVRPRSPRSMENSGIRRKAGIVSGPLPVPDGCARRLAPRGTRARPGERRNRRARGQHDQNAGHDHRAAAGASGAWRWTPSAAAG